MLSSRNGRTGLRVRMALMDRPRSSSSWYEAIADGPVFGNASFRFAAEGKLQARFGLRGTELVLGSYSCALKEKHSILLQGRLYIFPHHIGFACDLLGQVKSIVLLLSDIVSIKKAKTALVVPNAINIEVSNGESFFFASFLSRNEAYGLVHDLWKIARGVAAVNDLSDGGICEGKEDELIRALMPHNGGTSGRSHR